MEKFIPKNITDEEWKALAPDRAYAARLKPGEELRIRLGTGVGLYFSVSSLGMGGLLVNNIDFATGDVSVESPFPNKKEVVIGRVDECEVKIKHAIVSRKHAVLNMDDGVIILTDLGSTNGTSLHKENVYFDIEEYLANHPLDKGKDSTLDWIHEAFGPELDDFLIRYQKGKKQ